MLDPFGQPQIGRPYDESCLNQIELVIKKNNPIEYVKRWEKLWREWEEGKITSTEEFCERWATEMACMIIPRPTAPLSPRSKDHSHQSTSDHFVSELETMKATLEGSQSYVPGKIAQVSDALESGWYLSRQRRHQMAQTLSRVQDTLDRSVKKFGDGIAALLQAIKDGLLPEAKGCKALQENFAEFLQGISQLSTLHDLAVKAYSKGLISENAKNEAFATGMSLDVQANNFLGLIRTRIKRDQRAYEAFLDILRSDPAYEHLVTLAGGS